MDFAGHRTIRTLTRLAHAGIWGVLSGCAPPVEVLGLEGTTGVISETNPTSPATGTVGGGTEAQTDTSVLPCDPDVGCQNKVDLLFIIDNSGTMGEEQRTLAANFPLLIEQLEALEDGNGNRVGVDVNIMVTTTDFRNPECTPFQKADYEPANGAPIFTACTERITRFTGLGMNAPVFEEACTERCDATSPVYPMDQFIHFDPNGHNVVGGSPADALSCIGPQGIDGCGYESPLETMSQALNPNTCWNEPSACEGLGEDWDFVTKPFLREGSVLAVAIITDEADCSVQNYAVMGDESFMETRPGEMTPSVTSALCWNAGVECTGFDPGTLEYDECRAVDRFLDGDMSTNAALHPVSRYTDLLGDLGNLGHEVIMLGVLGVPEVVAHNPDPPHNPIEGGVDALVYRDWIDDQFPAGDILPDDWNNGMRAQDKQAEFGIGPGCTAFDQDIGAGRGQAIPPVRIVEVCESLNIPDNPNTAEVNEAQVRCCIESICDDDFSPAIKCLTGLIQDILIPVG